MPTRCHDAPCALEALQAVTVQETEDAWLIPDSIIAIGGVFNRKLRTIEELGKTAKMWEGAPLIHIHPEEPVVTGGDLRMVGGRVENVRIDAAARGGRGALVGTYRLYRKPVEGMDVKARALELNAAAVQLMRAGKPVSNSIGFLHDSLPVAGRLDGADYSVQVVNIVPNHVALYGAAGNPTETACPFPICGPGAGQEAEGGCCRVAYAQPQTPAPATNPPMPDCGKECKDKHDAAMERASKAEQTLTNLAGVVGCEAKDLPATVRKLATDKAAAESKASDFEAKLKPLQAAEERRHATALKAVIDAEAKAVGQEADRSKLEEEFKGYSTEQLDRHLRTLSRALPGARDGTRVGAAAESSAQLGVATAAKVWPRKEA